MKTRRGRHFIGTGHVIGIAHRGASRYAPENTLAAFHLAIKHGLPAVECDVRRTRDGHLVAIHDVTVNRTTDGFGFVSDYSLKSLKRLDAGRWFGFEFAGERIPLLDEVLDIVQGRAFLYLEIKNGPIFYDGIEKQILDTIRRHDMEDTTLVASFDHQCIRKIRALSNRLATGISYGSRFVDAPAAARAAKADALCVQWGFATKDVAAQARAAGLGFFVWTVDDEAVLRRCLSYGVDGIASNDIKLLTHLLPSVVRQPLN
jgi:glycerophosphoryl diester phosphodiesterase